MDHQVSISIFTLPDLHSGGFYGRGREARDSFRSACFRCGGKHMARNYGITPRVIFVSNETGLVGHIANLDSNSNEG